jgi:hypothetical protein
MEENENSGNDFSIQQLNHLKNTIEQYDKYNQIEILKIIHKKSNIFINENQYGTGINLTHVDNDTIYEIIKYVSYVTAQELNIKNDETIKDNYKNCYFS